MKKEIIIKQKIQNLRKEINEHNYKYYILSKPTISDVEFDVLLAKLVTLESKYPQYSDSHSPTQKIGSDIQESFIQKPHKYPMYSLGNTYTLEEIKDFDKRTIKLLNSSPDYVCELKYDGVSINLLYTEGKLTRALTRGDGIVGDDVTTNIKTIKSIPLILRGNDYPREFEIRGEVFLPIDVFEKLNEERRINNETIYSNPRNTASGTLKLLDSTIVAKRNLECYFYQIVGESLPLSTHYDSLQKIKEWGFLYSPNSTFCKNINEVFSFIHYWQERRKNLNVNTDGIVIKVNSLRQQKILGFTSKFPRWAIAFKYKAETATSKLLSVDYQVGRTGNITPVANLEKVFLSGTFVKRATLHNEAFIKELDLYKGDVVAIEKGGEIIPKVLDVDVSKRGKKAKKIFFVNNCPACDTLLEKELENAAYFCPNENNCPPQIKGKILHFIQRKAMNINNLGKKTINLLYNKQLLLKSSDLYNLKVEDLSSLERLGKKSAQNIIKSINASKTVPFHRVLYGLGIRYVGETVAKILADSFLSLENLRNATFTELIQIDEIGDKIAKSILCFFNKHENKILIKNLEYHGLQFSFTKQNMIVLKTNKLLGLRIVISGIFEKASREVLKNIIEENGGKNTSSLTKSTDYLVVGKKAGEAKLEKAKRLNTKVISEDELFNLIAKF